MYYYDHNVRNGSDESFCASESLGHLRDSEITYNNSSSYEAESVFVDKTINKQNMVPLLVEECEMYMVSL